MSTEPTLAHIQSHLELARQGLQAAYTQLNMAMEKLEKFVRPAEPAAAEKGQGSSLGVRGK